MENRFFLDLKYISISFDKLIEKKTGFTSAQLRIIGFLMHMRDEHRDVYQKDIEDIVGVSRAAVSAILDKMERSTLIVRISSPLDKRMKKVELTELGKKAANDVYMTMCSIEDDICSSLSMEEKATIFNVQNKLIDKLEDLGC